MLYYVAKPKDRLTVPATIFHHYDSISFGFTFCILAGNAFPLKRPQALSRALWGIRSFAHTIILFTCKQHLNKTCYISIPYIRLGTTGNSLFFLVFNLLPCTLHCFFQLAKILCRHFLRNGHFCSCFDSFECL